MKLRQILLTFLSSTTLVSALALPPPSHAPTDNPKFKAWLESRRRKGKDKGMPKYFHEPGGSEIGQHYDSRFYSGIDTYENRRDTQFHMLRAYFTFFSEASMETWLAHGTLLGWWWNGKMLPWDWDIDTQVSGSTLAYMGKHHNQTIYNYTSVDHPDVRRSYLLDVNPASYERERGNGNNIIDARWIDIRNGLYIDVTGLSETHPDDNPGVWSCKNYHRYHTTDLYPMRETIYEGVVARVPYAYDRILTQEYEEKALVVTDYEGHRWNPNDKEWQKKSDEEIATEKAEKEAKKKAAKEEKERKEAEKKKQEEEAKNNDKKEEKNEEKKDENKKEKRGFPEEPRVKLEKETSGLAHLRRKRDVNDVS